MNSWLSKFRISNAVDCGKPLPPGLQQKVAQSQELSQFQAAVAVTDRSLKQEKPAIKAPTSLHQSILRAVRVAQPRTEPVRAPALLRWWPAPALTVLVALGLWSAFHKTAAPVAPGAAEAQPLAGAATVLEVGDRIARGIPVQAVAPMTEELNRLNRDLESTAQFLLANVP